MNFWIVCSEDTTDYVKTYDVVKSGITTLFAARTECQKLVDETGVKHVVFEAITSFIPAKSVEASYSPKEEDDY
jgi:hypothetical protein